MAFSYIGGKSQIGNWIKDYIPTDIETYVEPFSGAFWVYLNMDLSKYKNLTKIVYNDFSPSNANIFNCLRTPEKFYDFMKNEECQVKDKSKEGQDSPQELKDKFYEYQKSAFDENRKIDLNNPDFQWGVEYAYVITQIFSGSKPEKSGYIDLKYKYRSKFDTFRDKVGGIGQGKEYPEYFRRITNVHNLDFQKVIEMYDSPTSYFYCDPPYWQTEDYYSAHDFGRKDHERLANILKNCKGKWSLSYYDFPDLHTWFPEDKYKWERKSFKKGAAAKAGVKQNDSVELLIMNY